MHPNLSRIALNGQNIFTTMHPSKMPSPLCRWEKSYLEMTLNELRRSDIASREVILNRSIAQNFVRFYFRPRTPTQFYVEGIRRTGDFYQGEANCHAPILVMFLFDIVSVLTKEGTFVSDGNMQRQATKHDNTDAFFATIDFQRVFHEGRTNDTTITNSRHAEVLAASPLPLNKHLKWVYCRSSAERTFLLHELGRYAASWKDLILVSDDMNLFERRYCFVKDVYLRGDGLCFALNGRFDGVSVALRVNCYKMSNEEPIISFESSDFAPIPRKGPRWIIKHDIAPGRYHCTIHVDNFLAFKGDLLHTDAPF